jgi:hypothetical protein
MATIIECTKDHCEAQETSYGEAYVYARSASWWSVTAGKGGCLPSPKPSVGVVPITRPWSEKRGRRTGECTSDMRSIASGGRSETNTCGQSNTTG